MVDLTSNSNYRKNTTNDAKRNIKQSKSVSAMCKMSADIINQLYNPIDAINRFINLALQSDDEVQSRQFLIESKRGIRKTSLLLRRLTNYTKSIEREVNKIKESESE